MKNPSTDRNGVRKSPLIKHVLIRLLSRRFSLSILALPLVLGCGATQPSSNLPPPTGDDPFLTEVTQQALTQMSDAHIAAAVAGSRLFTSDDVIVDYMIATVHPDYMHYKDTLVSEVYRAWGYGAWARGAIEGLEDRFLTDLSERQLAVQVLAAYRQWLIDNPADPD